MSPLWQGTHEKVSIKDCNLFLWLGVETMTYFIGTVQWIISGDKDKARRELTGLAQRLLYKARNAKDIGNLVHYDTGWWEYPQGRIRVLSQRGIDTVYMEAVSGGEGIGKEERKEFPAIKVQNTDLPLGYGWIITNWELKPLYYADEIEIADIVDIDDDYETESSYNSWAFPPGYSGCPPCETSVSDGVEQTLTLTFTTPDGIFSGTYHWYDDETHSSRCPEGLTDPCEQYGGTCMWFYLMCNAQGTYSNYPSEKAETVNGLYILSWQEAENAYNSTHYGDIKCTGCQGSYGLGWDGYHTATGLNYLRHNQLNKNTFLSIPAEHGCLMDETVKPPSPEEADKEEIDFKHGESSAYIWDHSTGNNCFGGTYTSDGDSIWERIQSMGYRAFKYYGSNKKDVLTMVGLKRKLQTKANPNFGQYFCHTSRQISLPNTIIDERKIVYILHYGNQENCKFAYLDIPADSNHDGYLFGKKILSGYYYNNGLVIAKKVKK